MYSNNQYNKVHKLVAKKLRNEMTKAEACLWKYALKSKQTGFIFKKQRPIGKYIVDFVCKELQLVIEVDGASHEHEKVLVNDQKKQEYLEFVGYKVLRYTDEEVLKNMDGVVVSLHQIIQNLEKTM